ncbi:hypothetical protein PIB30_104263, partial [Stylosanthes scabra]|nr:hypothetical protein [Stylosanthes scabra]
MGKHWQQATSLDHAYAWWSQSSTHMRGKLTQVTSKLSNYHLPSTHMRTFLRICVGLSPIGHRPTPHAYNYTDQHTRGGVTPDHAYAYAWDSHPFGHGPTPHAHNYTDHAYA